MRLGAHQGKALVPTLVRPRARAKHRARSRPVLLTRRLGLGALLVLSGAVTVTEGVRLGAAAGDAAGAVRHAPAAVQSAGWTSMYRRQCIAAVTVLLRTDLLDMATGRPDAGPPTKQLVERQYLADSAVLLRIHLVHDALLGTAASDLFDRYARQVPAELIAYGPRIAAGCG